MWVIIITGIIGLLFIGGLAYQWSGPVLAARKGRQVDVRVRSCVQKEIPGRVSWQPTVYYEVIVDFYGLNGEALMGSIQSETPYMQGDVIHCRYLDRTGFLLSETATEVQKKAKYKLLLLLFFSLLLWGCWCRHYGMWMVRNTGSSILARPRRALKRRLYWSCPATMKIPKGKSLTIGFILMKTEAGVYCSFP